MREEMQGLEERDEEKPSATGGCLCGAVRFRLFGPLRDIVNCHCGQCRRSHGNFAAYTRVKRAAFTFDERQGLRWFNSSDRARRGFCRHCGASLFWERTDGQTISIAAGCLDQPSGLKTTQDIFVSDKGDFYELAAGTKVTLHGGLSEEENVTSGIAAGGQAPADMSDLRSGTSE